jgi:undecaprenyl diphosphate synthase
LEDILKAIKDENLNVPKHVAIILDGNGRWAKKRNMPRNYGHVQGSKTVEQIIEDGFNMGIEYITVYAFSTENWKRPEDEVSYLCKLPGIFFDRFMKELMANNIKVTFAGELERFPDDTQKVIRRAVDQSKDNTGLNLCIAINYGSRREILLAMQHYAEDVKNGRANDITEEEVSSYLMVPENVDLMIRTSGECRISNYLLWQIAYAELIFTETAWPDFDEAALDDCIDKFNQRDRRFGGLSS